MVLGSGGLLTRYREAPPTPGVSQEWCYWTCMCLGQLCQEELGEAQSWKKEVELGGSMGTQEKDDKC